MPKTISKKERCSEQGIPDRTGWHYYQCSRRGTIDEDGKLWCFQHAPSAKRKRRGESDARYKADQDRRLAPWRELDRLRTVNAKLLAALEKTLARLEPYPNRISGWGITNQRPHTLVEDIAAAIEEAKK